MLTMTVMQHEREAVGQCSPEPAEAEDVLSRLRHLNNTLQECHWRMQLVDHALCAQGHHGQQNQTGIDHSFEVQARNNSSLQNQAQENYSFQLEIGNHCKPLNKAGKHQDVEEFRETIDDKEQLGDDGLQNQPNEDQNCQKGAREKSENLFCEDYNHQKPAEEKHSFLDVTIKDKKRSVQVEDNLQDLYSDAKKKTLHCTTGDSDLLYLDRNDILPNYAKKDNHIHNETEEENDIKKSIKNPCGLGSTDSLKKQLDKYSTRQEFMDMDNDDDDDPWPADTMDVFDADEISPVLGIRTDINDQYLQLINLNAKFSENILKQEDLQKSDHVGEVRYRLDSMQDSKNETCHEGGLEFCKYVKKDNTSKDYQPKNKYVDKLSPVHTSQEVVHRMDIIWEALKNLQSHFHALDSSLVDSSNLFCGKNSAQLPDYSYNAIRENEKVGNHPHCVCQNLSTQQISSPTFLQEPANSSPLSDNLTHGRAYLQSWRDTCLCIVIIVLLLLLFLFLASCLLLVLPVVSVSVRTAGGLPAF